jgi:hypothetical protein
MSVEFASCTTSNDITVNLCSLRGPKEVRHKAYMFDAGGESALAKIIQNEAAVSIKRVYSMMLSSLTRVFANSSLYVSQILKSKTE